MKTLDITLHSSTLDQNEAISLSKAALKNSEAQTQITISKEVSFHLDTQNGMCFRGTQLTCWELSGFKNPSLLHATMKELSPSEKIRLQLWLPALEIYPGALKILALTSLSNANENLYIDLSGVWIRCKTLILLQSFSVFFQNYSQTKV